MNGLISIAGTPSRTLYATMNVVRALTQVLLGDHIVVIANSLEVLRKEFPSPAARRGQSVVLFSDYPEPELLGTLYQFNAPLAVCVDDFATIATDCAVSRGFGGAAAARFAMMGLVYIERTTVSPPPLSVIVNDPNIALATLIDDLAALYRLPTEADSLAKVLAFLGQAEQGDLTLAEYAALILPFLRTRARFSSSAVRWRMSSSTFLPSNMTGSREAAASKDWNGRSTRSCGPISDRRRLGRSI